MSNKNPPNYRSQHQRIRIIQTTGRPQNSTSTRKYIQSTSTRLLLQENNIYFKNIEARLDWNMATKTTGQDTTLLILRAQQHQEEADTYQEELPPVYWEYKAAM